MDGRGYETTGTLRAVAAYWNDDGWNVNANAVTNPNTWNDDNQVFSRNCRMIPPAISREVCFQGL